MKTEDMVMTASRPLIGDMVRQREENRRIRDVLFELAAEAADTAIGSPADRRNRHDGGQRIDGAGYTALLAVIAAAGLAGEYARYRAAAAGRGKEKQ